jgi:hypothetical protein
VTRVFRNCYLGLPAFLVAWLTIGAGAAHAYVGPTAGIGLFSAAMGFLVAFVSAIGVILAWPLRALMRKIRGPKAKQGVESANA